MSLTLVSLTIGVHGQVSGEGTDNGNRCSLTSYDPLDRFIARHADDIAPDAWVIDLTPLNDRDDIVSLAWRAPMIDPRLGDDEIDRWDGAAVKDDPIPLAAILAGNYFGTAGVIAATTTTTDAPGSFDHVSPSGLAAYWRGHGARIGRYADGAVVWEGSS